MATVFIRKKASQAEDNHDSKSDPDTSTTSINTIPPLGEAFQAKRFWFQRTRAYDADAVATQASLPYSWDTVDPVKWLTVAQASVFDDPETAKQYQPPPEW